MLWKDKPYHSLNYHLQSVYGEKIYKLALNGGMTCPNRDGTLGENGCIFCSAGGSGEFAGKIVDSIAKQIEHGKNLLKNKADGIGYIGYFQAYTNTYAPLDYLRKIFMETVSHPDIRILSIATRPDCLSDDILELLSEINQIKPVWIELGLQTIHEETARFIRREYTLPCFEDAVFRLTKRGISVITHIILGLPGETREMILETVRFMNTVPIQGVKLQLLHVLTGTELEEHYRNTSFSVLTLDEYIRLIGESLCLLNPEIIIHRITGDGPKKLLIAPEWSKNKRLVLNTIHKYMKENSLWQGKYF